MQMLRSFERKLAYHEAGHAVVTELLRGHTIWCRIWDGANFTPENQANWSHLKLEIRLPRMAKAALGSLISETINLGQMLPEIEQRAKDDLKKARQCAWLMLPEPRPELHTWDGHASVSELQNEVSELLKVGANELAVHLVATRLIKKNSLTRPEVVDALSEAMNTYSEEILMEARKSTEAYVPPAQT